MRLVRTEMPSPPYQMPRTCGWVSLNARPGQPGSGHSWAADIAVLWGHSSPTPRSTVFKSHVSPNLQASL